MSTYTLPTNSYNIMKMQKRLNPRLYYIKSIQAHTPNTCTECNTELAIDNDEVYCPQCGLIHQASSDFHAGTHFHLPYGLRLG